MTIEVSLDQVKLGGSAVSDMLFRRDNQTLTVTAARFRPVPEFLLDWEQTDEWTTMEREEQFWGWASSRPGVSIRTVHTTLEGRSIREAVIGNQDGPAFLLVGGVHGREPAGREVALMVLRDMIEGAWSDLLENHCVVFIPNANPDGRANNTRGNSAGLDVNRDVYTLDTVEAETVATVIRDREPVMLVDMHQYNGDGVHWFWTARNSRINTPADMAALGDEAVDLALDAVEAIGYNSTRWTSRGRGGVRESSTFHHCVGILAESRIRDYTRADAINVLRAGADVWLDFFHARSDELADAREASIQRALTAGPPDLVNLKDQNISEANSYNIYIDGYNLTEPLPEKHREVFNIESDEGFVPIQQMARGILPELMDPDLDEPTIQASRVEAD